MTQDLGRYRVSRVASQRGSFLLEIDGADHFTPVSGDGSPTLGPAVYSIVVAFLDAFVAGTSDSDDLARAARSSTVGTWFSAED